MLKKPPDEPRNVERNELVNYAALKALFGEPARGDSPRCDKHAESSGTNPLDERQDAGEFADTCAMKPDEWTFRPESLEAWRRRKLEDPRFDASVWAVAREGGEVCGVALSTVGQFDMGFVNALAVRPAWRRRGLGLALLQQAFTWFWERGERRVGLGVDTENTTDALRLYERAGMRAVWQADVHEKVLRGE
jgi:GNAT superfamily N-acetyltransferase